MSHAREHYEYEAQQARQNRGKECEFCESEWGHFRTCPLINGGVTKITVVEFTEGDRLSARALGVIL